MTTVVRFGEERGAMRRLGIGIGLGILAGAGGSAVYAQPQAAEQAAQVYAVMSQEQAVAMVEKLGFLIEGAQITRVESVAEPYDSWKISFSAEPGQWYGNPLYYGSIEPAKRDGAIIAVDVRKGIGRTKEYVFDISQEKVDKDKARALVEDFISDNPWLSALTLIYSPYPLSQNETRHEDRSVHRVNAGSSAVGAGGKPLGRTAADGGSATFCRHGMVGG